MACLPFGIDRSLIETYIVLESLNERKLLKLDSDLKTHEKKYTKSGKFGNPRLQRRNLKNTDGTGSDRRTGLHFMEITRETGGIVSRTKAKRAHMERDCYESM